MAPVPEQTVMVYREHGKVAGERLCRGVGGNRVEFKNC